MHNNDLMKPRFQPRDVGGFKKNMQYDYYKVMIQLSIKKHLLEMSHSLA